MIIPEFINSTYSDISKGNNLPTLINNEVVESVGVPIPDTTLQGILLEPAATSYVPSDLTNGLWNKIGCTVVADTYQHKNIQFQKLVEGTGSGSHYLRKTDMPVGTKVSCVLAKADERSILALEIRVASGAYHSNKFHLGTGTILNTVWDGTIRSAFMIPWGDGVYLCGLYHGNFPADRFLIGVDNAPTAGSTAYAGDGSSGILLAIPQSTELPVPTSLMRGNWLSTNLEPRAATSLTLTGFGSTDVDLKLTIKPVWDFGNVGIANVILFKSLDNRGTSKQLTTIGGLGYFFDGSVFTINVYDFLKDVSYDLQFKLTQEGANYRAEVILDGVEKLNVVQAGTLDHSNTGNLELGQYANFKSVDFTVGPPDTIAPVITLNGPSYLTVDQNGSYTDAGATALDNIDGALTPTSSGSVNTAVLGLYTITFNISDAAGNAAIEVSRIINVVDPAAQTSNVFGISGINRRLLGISKNPIKGANRRFLGINR